jgi:DnaK suppressor protein
MAKNQAGISQNTIDKLEKLLLKEKARLEEQKHDLEEEAREMVEDREHGDTQFDEESGEGDNYTIERERTLFLSANAQGTISLIEDALGRIKDGTYGVCLGTGKKIPIPRLEAVPWAEYTVEYKAQLERRN